jgi:predicted Zn-dependent peptidase
MVTEEIEQLTERRMKATADTNPSVQLRWHTVPFVHKDVYAVDVVEAVLSGRTGRLYKTLVEAEQIATGEPYAVVRAFKYGGFLEIGAELADGVDHSLVEEALLAEIERLKNELVPERELQKVKNQSLADSYRRLQSNYFLMVQLLWYRASGDWHYLNDSTAKYEAVTADDVQRVAKTYFTDTGRNVLWYFRNEGSEEDPDLAALTGQAKAMAKQALAQIAEVEDPAELEQGLQQMQTMKGQAPPEYQPAIELIIKRATERIEKLRAAAGEEE